MTADGGAWQGGWTSRTTGTYRRTVRTAGMDRAIGVVTGLAASGNPDVSYGCVNPQVNIEQPTTSAFAMVGTPGNPRKFIVRLRVTDTAGNPVAGLTADAFTVEARKAGTATLIPANVINASYVQDDYWLLVRAPNESQGAELGAFYDLRVSLGAANDSENSALVYLDRDQDVMLVLDRSGSMSTNNRLAAARNAAALIANQLQLSDQGGYVAFDTDAQLRRDLQDISAASRTALINSISGETLGDYTSIGDGMQRAEQEFDEAHIADNLCSYVLMTDGYENEPALWATVRADVIDNGCAIHGIALGPSANEPLVQQIAASVPGGSYDYAPDTGGTSIGSAYQPADVPSSPTTLGWANNLARVYDNKVTMLSGRQRAFTGIGGPDAASACDGPSGSIDFEDQPAGTEYPVPTSFDSQGVNITTHPFTNADGSETDGEGSAIDTGDGATDIAILSGYANFSFALPQLCRFAVQYNDGGGGVNLEVNGDRRVGGGFSDFDGMIIGGALVDTGKDASGTLIVSGEIHSISLGGGEMFFDDVRYRRPGAPEADHEFCVDETADELMLSLGWQLPDGHTTELRDPNGDPVDPSAFRRLSPNGTNEVWEIPLPMPGCWQLFVDGLDQEFLVTAQLRSDYELFLFAGAPLDGSEEGARVPINASFVGPAGGVLGAHVTADVTGPAGDLRRLTLWDDGMHEDGEAEDGVYGNLYTATSLGDFPADDPEEGDPVEMVGSYLVNVVAVKGNIVREAQTSFALGQGADSDNDGIPDAWETVNGTDPLTPDGDGDPDRDELSSYCEFLVGTHPLNPDTDGGGESDGSEVSPFLCVVTGQDPNDPADDRIRRFDVLVDFVKNGIDPPYLQVHWSRPPGQGTTFDVFRRCRTGDGPFGDWEQVADDIPRTHYRDLDVALRVLCEYQVVATDNDGDQSVSPPTDGVRVRADAMPPDGVLVIDGGATQTADLLVDLTLIGEDTDLTTEEPSATPGGTPTEDLEMLISNDPSFADADWQPFDSDVEDWDLGDVDPGGVATVFFQLRDEEGNHTSGPTRFDSILYVDDTRESGPTRIETAVDIAQGSYDDDEAEVVVLARADEFADALAGTPLAVRRHGPMLLTYPDQLHPNTAAELQRVLPAGRTVILLGGPVALSLAVEQQVKDLGYQTLRLQGPSRVETAIAVADEIGEPAQLLITTGYNFPDALAAGAAAAKVDGAVLLTSSEARHPAVDAYLDDHGERPVWAVGGPAARPYPEATALFGPSREETAVAVADEFFLGPQAVGLARRDDFADALTGGVHIGARGGPMLLTPTESLHPAPEGYLCAHAESLEVPFVYGGEVAISAGTQAAYEDRVDGVGCPG